MISILITHYNRFESLVSCLEVFKSLDLGAVEIVVSDDGSDEKTQQLLKTLDVDVMLLHEKNTGLTSNLNRGINACTGEFILYCQEDFIPKKDLALYLDEAKGILNANKADMCRLRANYRFPKLYMLSDRFKLIPKFAWRNFYLNTFQYSDHPFITKKHFFDKYGFYLENVSGPYGENEYAIRIMKSKAKIAIAEYHPFKQNTESESVIMHGVAPKKRLVLKRLNLYKLLRAIRLHFEFLVYNKKRRTLVTIKNKRQ